MTSEQVKSVLQSFYSQYHLVLQFKGLRLYLHEKSIIRDSTDYQEFWKFAEKFQTFIRMQPNRTGTYFDFFISCLISIDFNHGGTRYDRALRLNLQTRNYRIEDYMRHRMAEVDESHRRRAVALTDQNLRAVHLMYDMYLDFLMKQRVSFVLQFFQS